LNRIFGLATVLLGKVLAQGALLAYGVAAARIAGPREFALFSTMLTVVLLLDACIGAPLDYTTVRFAAVHSHDPELTERIQMAGFRAKMLIGGSLFVAAMLFGRSLAGMVLHDSGRPELIWIAAPTTWMLLILRSLAAYLQIQSRFRAYSSLDMALGAVRVGMVGAFALAGVARAEWYLGAFGGSAMIPLVAGMWVVPRSYLRARWPAREDRRTIVSYFGITVGVIILGTMTGRSDLLFLASAVEPATLARYAAAGQLASIATLIAGYASVTVQPVLIPAVREGRFREFLAGSMMLSAPLVLVALLAVWGFGSSIMSVVYGAKFESSAMLLGILTIGTCIDLLCMPVAMTFVLQMRPSVALWGELAIAIVYFAAVVPVGTMGVEAMAWLVTGIRAMKCAFYLSVVLYDGGHRRRVAVAASSVAVR
jgi:O-antigen/teichoic acid export membrane protein